MNRMLRVYYGGSFDPVHHGHLAVARTARDVLAAEVALVPARDPPNKPSTSASAEQRAAMLELAIEGESGLRVDRRELRRPGPSWTVDTLAELRAQSGAEAPLVWLIGADSLRQLHTWHRWRKLFALAHVVAVPRLDAANDAACLQADAPLVAAEVLPRACAPAELAMAPAGRFCRLPMPQPRPESSTELRRRIAAGDASWRNWVPPAVADYIAEQTLYGVSAAILPPSPPSARP